jgi:phosphomannomutase
MVEQVAQALADCLNEGCFDQPESNTAKQVAIAYDSRRRSREFAHLFAQVLSGNGIGVLLANRITPTPVLSYTVKARSLNVGVAITASHNPPEYNGFKFKGAYGGPFLLEATQQIEQHLGQSPVRSSQDSIQFDNFLPDYCEHLRSLVDLDAIGKAGLQVLVDSMGGVGQHLFESLLTPHGCQVTTLDGEAREDFGGRTPEPIAKHLQPLQLALQEGNYALGMATDGDGDRLGVLLEDGTWLSAQETILLLADYLLNQRGIPGDIVKTSSVTDKLRELFPSRHIWDVQVGFPYICRKMLAGDVALGVEESGGYGCSLHLPERDGFFSGLVLLEMLAQSGYRTLEDYVAAKREQLGCIYYDRVDCCYTGENFASLLPTLAQSPPHRIDRFEVRHVDEFRTHLGVLNGLKFRLEGDPRWLLLRASETEPLLRVYAEGRSPQEVAQLIAAGWQLVNV